MALNCYTDALIYVWRTIEQNGQYGLVVARLEAKQVTKAGSLREASQQCSFLYKADATVIRHNLKVGRWTFG